MNLIPVLLTAAAPAAPTTGEMLASMLPTFLIMGVMIYFMIYRPQKKQQKKQDELINSIEIGDSILTTSGFYGVVIDNVDDDVIIVEFGNNKNCRIPMKKSSIVEVEKPEKE